MHYAKLHGCENAYVFVREEDVRDRNLAEIARAVSVPRPAGIGSDGLIVCAPADQGDVRMIMFNADGSRGTMCGNGIRGLAKWVLDGDATIGATLAEAANVAELRDAIATACAPLAVVCNRVALPDALPASLRRLNVQTDAGMRVIHAVMIAGSMRLAAVDMGDAIIGFRMNSADFPVNSVTVQVDGLEFQLALVSVGNHHAVTFVDDVDAVVIERVGPLIQGAAVFPEPVNVHFVQRVDRATLKMRPWERGSGATPACGTGACAAAIAAGDVDDIVEVHQPGGGVFVHRDRAGAHTAGCRVHMIGSAELVETGDWELSA